MNSMRNLVLLINNYWKQQTDNNKTLILFFYWLQTVTPCSKFCINITHLNESETLITVMTLSDNVYGTLLSIQVEVEVRVIFLWRFFTWPRNYYNDNKLDAWMCSQAWHFSESQSLQAKCWERLKCNTSMNQAIRGRRYMEKEEYVT